MIRAYVVLEIFGNDDPHPIGDCHFVVAPRVGEAILLRIDGERIVADVTSVLHTGIQSGETRDPAIQVVALQRAQGDPH